MVNQINTRSILQSDKTPDLHLEEEVEKCALKPSRGFSGNLKPEQKKTTRWTTICPMTDKLLKRQPSEKDWGNSHYE